MYIEDLRTLQHRLNTIHSMKYLYYFMRVDEAKQEIGNLRQAISHQEVQTYNLSSFAYFATCVTFLRSFFDDKDRSDCSLFNLYRSMVERGGFKDYQLHNLFILYKMPHQRNKAKNLIGEHILGKEPWQRFLNIKSFVNDHIAHLKNDNKTTKQHDPASSYENLESVLIAIDHIMYKKLPKLLYGQEDEAFDHNATKAQIKIYLLNRFRG